MVEILRSKPCCLISPTRVVETLRADMRADEFGDLCDFVTENAKQDAMWTCRELPGDAPMSQDERHEWYQSHVNKTEEADLLREAKRRGLVCPNAELKREGV